MPKFRKKPVVIEAVQWTGENVREMADFLDSYRTVVSDRPITIITLEGNLRADVGDWIIKGIQGEFYPCKSDIFEKTYEQVSCSGPKGYHDVEEFYK